MLFNNWVSFNGVEGGVWNTGTLEHLSERREYIKTDDALYAAVLCCTGEDDDHMRFFAGLVEVRLCIADHLAAHVRDSGSMECQSGFPSPFPFNARPSSRLFALQLSFDEIRKDGQGDEMR